VHVSLALLLLAAVEADARPFTLVVDDPHACVDENELTRALVLRLPEHLPPLHIDVITRAQESGDIVVRVRARAQSHDVPNTSESDPRVEDELTVDESFTVALEACQTVPERAARIVGDAMSAHASARALLEPVDAPSVPQFEAGEPVRDDAATAIDDDAPSPSPPDAPTVWFARPRFALGLALGAPPLVPDARGSVELALGHRAFPSLLFGIESAGIAPIGAGSRTAIFQPMTASVGVGFDRWFEYVSLGARALLKGGAALVWDGALDVDKTELRPWVTVEGAFLVVTRYGPSIECGIDVPLFSSGIVDEQSGEEFVLPPAYAFVKLGFAVDFSW
jgi:hypothetical protein